MLVLVGKFATKCDKEGLLENASLSKPKLLQELIAFIWKNLRSACTLERSCTCEGCFSTPTLTRCSRSRTWGSSREGYKSPRLGKGGCQKGSQTCPHLHRECRAVVCEMSLGNQSPPERCWFVLLFGKILLKQTSGSLIENKSTEPFFPLKHVK